jgi:hypothetical protein
MAPWTVEEVIVLIWFLSRGVKQEAVRELIKHKCEIQRTLQSITSKAEDVCYVEERSVNPDLRFRRLGRQRLDDGSTWVKAKPGEPGSVSGPVEEFILRQLDDIESDTEILEALLSFGAVEREIVTVVRLAGDLPGSLG